MQTEQEKIKTGRIYLLIFVICTLLLASSIILTPLDTILPNLLKIQTSSQRLFSDTFYLAGRGASVLNASLIGYFVLAMLLLANMKPDGFTVACVFLSMGFGFAGISLLSLLPIVFGTWIFAKIKSSRFKNYCNECILAFGLSPVINQIAFGYTPAFAKPGQIIMALAVAILIGMSVPAISKEIGKNQGKYKMQYELAGMGLITLIYYSGYKSVVIDRYNNNPLAIMNNISSYNSNYWAIFIILFLLAILIAYLMNKNCFKEYIAQIKSNSSDDYISEFSFTSILINISTLGLLSLVYFAIVGMKLNGIAFCALFTVLAMACIRLNPFHIPFAIIGVLISAYSCLHYLNDPIMIIGFSFSLGISAVYKNTSAIYVIIAGIIFNYLNIFASELFAGLNLYIAGTMMGISIFTVELLHKAFTYKEEKLNN